MKYDFNKLSVAGSIVEGLNVTQHIPNQSSISSSLGKFIVLNDIREVSMEFFTYTPPYSVSEYKKTEKLKEEIEKNQYIDPLIVVWDSEGLYILEGGHRFDALNMLGIKSFPALIVKDLDSFFDDFS